MHKVDKNGLHMNGMWDPTFAPSLRRLSQLGFSPKKPFTCCTCSNENQGDSDQHGSYYYHDAIVPFFFSFFFLFSQFLISNLIFSEILLLIVVIVVLKHTNRSSLKEYYTNSVHGSETIWRIF